MFFSSISKCSVFFLGKREWKSDFVRGGLESEKVSFSVFKGKFRF